MPIMKIPGSVHCLFEQSGTFKDVFLDLGYPAFDYDISDDFGKTDYVLDLFSEIEKAYLGDSSVFDRFLPEDLLIAFFPCTYFSTMSSIFFSFGIRFWSKAENISNALHRLETRTRYHSILLKLLYVVHSRNLRMILENPYTKPGYLVDGSNFPSPDLVDKNRSLRGDYFRKPTAYWFFNCLPGSGFYEAEGRTETVFRIDKIHGFERSRISSVYAQNFIRSFILDEGQIFDLF